MRDHVMRNSRSAILVALFTAVAPLACDSAAPSTPDSGATRSGGASGSGGGNSAGGGGNSAGSGGNSAGSAGTMGSSAAGTGGSQAGGAGTSTGGAGSGGRGGANSSTGGAGPGGRGGASNNAGGAGPGGRTGAMNCTYGGQTHPVGASFPATDGCNTCTCGANGSVGCTKIGCVDGGPDTTCVFDMPYKFWDDGGFRAYSDLSQVMVPHTHTVARDHHMNAPPVMCTREIPCDSTTEVDVAKIKQALDHPDVVAALAMTTKPFYGTDTRPSDGTVFMFERADKRGFSLGTGTTVPAGLRALEAVLHELQMQSVASPNCANLR